MIFISFDIMFFIHEAKGWQIRHCKVHGSFCEISTFTCSRDELETHRFNQYSTAGKLTYPVALHDCPCKEYDFGGRLPKYNRKKCLRKIRHGYTTQMKGNVIWPSYKLLTID